MLLTIIKITTVIKEITEIHEITESTEIIRNHFHTFISKCSGIKFANGIVLFKIIIK